jgi:Rha family phage regulatory protein
MTRTRRPSVKLVHGQAITTSLKVADYFGKRHDIVLRAIKNLDCPEDFRLRNFAESQYDVKTPTGGNKTLPMYTITRDGFALLAMGFTGREAMQWKIAYLEAFNKLEAAALEKLKARKTLPRAQRALPAPAAPVAALPVPAPAADNDLSARIARRAMELAFAKAEEYRARMERSPSLRHGTHRPENWMPEESSLQVAEFIHNQADALGTFIGLLHRSANDIERFVKAAAPAPEVLR